METLKQYKNLILVIILLVVGVAWFQYKAPSAISEPPLPPVVSPPQPLPVTFDQISPADQARIREIFTGVMQNTISITPDLKNELRAIFTKYNTTDAELNDFATYGPAFMVNYQKLFFADALQAVSSGYPTKSDERLKLENEALSRGLMTSERIKANDEEMKLIASHQPVVSADGREVAFSTEVINSTLININSTFARFKSLLE